MPVLFEIYYGYNSVGFYYHFSSYIIFMQRKKEDLCGVRDIQMLVATVLSVPCRERMLSVTGQAIPLQAWAGLKGSRSLRLPNFKTIGT